MRESRPVRRAAVEPGAEVDHGARWAWIPAIAAILEHDGHGIRRVGWQEREILGHWRRFFDRRNRILN